MGLTTRYSVHCRALVFILLPVLLAACAGHREVPAGYLAVPPGGNHPGVLVLHAWWGLNDTIRATCDRLAAEGYVVFAPDLYHGKIAHTVSEAGKLGSELDARYREASAEVIAAARYLGTRSDTTGHKLAVIGFSLGAFYALDLSVEDPDDIEKVVVFYGTGGNLDFSRSRAAYLGHFAENDPYETSANVDAFKTALYDAGRPASIYRYPGTGHWFFEPDVKQAYNEAAATLAWQRTLEFLRHH